MSVFVFSVLAGLLIHQLITIIQPEKPRGSPSRRLWLGRRIVLRLPERTYLRWKAYGLAAAGFTLVFLIALMVAQSTHPTEGYAYRFTDALTSPRVAAAFFGALVGLLVGNLLNRILRGQNYQLTGRDRLEVFLIFVLFLLGIGGEEIIQSAARRIDKISIGATNEISFSPASAQGAKGPAEQAHNAYIPAHNDQQSSPGSVDGLAAVVRLKSTIPQDIAYVELLRRHGARGSSAAGNARAAGGAPPELPPAEAFVVKYVSPVAQCIRSIYAQTTNASFMQQNVEELALLFSRLISKSENQVKLHSDMSSQLPKQMEELSKTASRLPPGAANDACTPLETLRSDLPADMLKIVDLGRFRTARPYLVMAYAGFAVQLGHYDFAASALHDWINDPDWSKDPDIAKDGLYSTWYRVRARITLSIYLEQWIRSRGDGAPLALRQYHVDNSLETFRMMGAFAAISEVKRLSGDYTISVGIFGATQSGDDQYCGVPSSERDDLGRLYESYLSMVSTYVDNALKHPIYRLEMATVIDGYAEQLNGTSLACVDAADRPAMRAEMIERQVRDQINLASLTAPLKSSGAIQDKLRDAGHRLNLAIELISTQVRQEKTARAANPSFTERISASPLTELYETLLATKAQLQDLQQRD